MFPRRKLPSPRGILTDVLGMGAKWIVCLPWALVTRPLVLMSWPALSSVTVMVKARRTREWRCWRVVLPRPPDTGSATTTEGQTKNKSFSVTLKTVRPGIIPRVSVLSGRTGCTKALAEPHSFRGEGSRKGDAGRGGGAGWVGAGTAGCHFVRSVWKRVPAILFS